jgi:hypothetical protein
MAAMTDEEQSGKPDRWARGISGTALVLSIISLFFFDVPERYLLPAVDLIMPPEARLAQIQNKPGSEVYSARVYLQPAFVSTGRSQRVAVLKSVNLFVQREGEQQCKKFWLDGIGSFADNPAGRGLTFTYESGAAPLVVTQDTPENNVLVFELRKDADIQHVEHPYFEGKDHYLMTLVAETNTKPKTLRSAINVSADEAALKARAQKYLEGPPEGRNFVTSGARQADTPVNCPSSG